MKHKWKTHKKNCQLRKGALHPGISSRDITEQLDSKEGGGRSRHKFAGNNSALTSPKEMVELLIFDLHHVFGWSLRSH